MKKRQDNKTQKDKLAYVRPSILVFWMDGNYQLMNTSFQSGNNPGSAQNGGNTGQSGGGAGEDAEDDNEINNSKRWGGSLDEDLF